MTRLVALCEPSLAHLFPPFSLLEAECWLTLHCVDALDERILTAAHLVGRVLHSASANTDQKGSVEGARQAITRKLSGEDTRARWSTSARFVSLASRAQSDLSSSS